MSAHPPRQPFSFTRRAIDRFAQRVWPSIASRPIADDREALALLCAAARTAEVLPRRSPLGHAMWITSDPVMRWITKPDEIRGRRVAVVVTVLGAAEDPAAEEQAERDVLEAHRRLAALPKLGRPESTSPEPNAAMLVSEKTYRAWVALELQRLSVERKRLSRVPLPAPPPKPMRHGACDCDLERERLQTERLRLVTQQHVSARRERTARHLAAQAHEALFRELLARLAEVDPAGSAELLERARARVAKWEAEGKAWAEGGGDG